MTGAEQVRREHHRRYSKRRRVIKDHIEVDGVRYVRDDSLTQVNGNCRSPAVLSLDTEHQNSHWDQDTVKCPNCGDATGLHINEVWLENAAGQRLVASAMGEGSESRLEVSLTNEGQSDGRRYTVTIAGECEHCTSFKLKFKQHKGQTYFTKVVEPRGE